MGNGEALKKNGWAPNTDGAVLRLVDPLPKEIRQKDEDPRGCAIRRHPKAMLLDDGELHDLLIDLEDSSLGSPDAEHSPEDLRARSHEEVMLIDIYRSARRRRRARDEKQERDRLIEETKRKGKPAPDPKGVTE